jgi:hypothetical protein
MLEFFRHVLFQHARVGVFENPLLHFLAVLGIDEDTYRLREGNDFSYMLAGIVYCCRVLGVEIILPKRFVGERRRKTINDFSNCDSNISPMAHSARWPR